MSWPSCFPSLCLSFLLAGQDTYAHFLSFGDPVQNQAPINLHKQDTGSNQWLGPQKVSVTALRLPTQPARVSGFRNSKFAFLSSQLVPKASSRNLPCLKVLKQVTSLSGDLPIEHAEHLL